MQPPLPPRHCRNAKQHALTTADAYFYGLGVLATMTTTTGSCKVAGSDAGYDVVQAQNVHVEAAPELQIPDVRQVLAGTGDRAHLPAAGRRARQHFMHRSERPAYFRRRITSATTLRSMHVTQAMVERLGLHEKWDVVDSSQPNEEQGRSRPDGQGPPTTSDRHPVFRRIITLRDTAGQVWPVVYDASMSNRQYHRRLSAGWAAFCRHHGMSVNDTVEFRRCSSPTDAVDLVVRVTRRGGGF